MITYRDMTFCPAEECLNFDTCPRALTNKVKAAAVRWWGSESAPISRFADYKNMECYDPVVMTKEDKGY